MNKKKIEILSPAGSFESLTAAIEAGCHGVYLGGQNFSARRLAANFSLEDLESAIDYSHLRDVKVYITVNTLYKNSEFSEVADFVARAASMGADAFIVQDMGIGQYIRKNYPNIQMHGSTQMTVHDIDGAIFLKENGFNRVVLSRELSLSEIKEIVENVDIETEVFVHGALCVCYSGQCLMSSLIGQRSGNRGNCAQPCRLKYSFYHEGNQVEKGYLMSTKDLMSLEFLPEIYETGVSSLKIEGRMKKPEYVYAVTSGYRSGLDMIETGLNKNFCVTAETKREMTQVFNRGGSFTEGYFKNYSGKEMMSIETPKNTGLNIGMVRYYNPKTGGCTIEINQPLSPGDGIEIWTKSEPHYGTYVNKEYNSPSVIEMRFQKKPDVSINKGDLVYKSFDKKLMDTLNNSLSRDLRKMSVNANVSAILNKELELEIFKNGISVKGKGGLVSRAINQPLSEEKFLSQLAKTGDTSLKFNFIDVQIDKHIYVGIKDINSLRREVCEEFMEKYAESFKRVVKQIKVEIDDKNKIQTLKKITVYVRNKEAFLAAMQKGVCRIYVETNNEFLSNMEEYLATAKKENIQVFAAMPRISKDNSYSRQLIKTCEASAIDGYLIRTWGQLKGLENSRKMKVSDYSFNIFNQFSSQFLKKYVDYMTLSTELSLKEINQNGGEYCEVNIFGRQVVMVTSQCPIGNYAGKKGTNKYCKLKDTKDSYYLKDRKNEIFPVLPECDFCNGIILNSKTLFTINKIADMKEMPIGFVRLTFTNETPIEIREIVKLHIEAFANETEISQNLLEKFRESGITNGHMYREID